MVVKTFIFRGFIEMVFNICQFDGTCEFIKKYQKISSISNSFSKNISTIL